MKNKKRISKIFFITGITLFAVGLSPQLTGYWPDQLAFKVAKVIGLLFFMLFVFLQPKQEKIQKMHHMNSIEP